MSTQSTLGTSVPRSAHTNLDLMRDFGFIKEYVKGLGVIGAYVRTYVPRGYLLRAIRTAIRTIRTGIRTYSYPYSDLFVTVFGLFVPFSQGVRPAMAVPPGICPRAATPYLRSGALGYSAHSATYSLGYRLSRSDSLRHASAPVRALVR